MPLDQFVASLPIEIWRGAARAWQCDEMGHLNASFYVSIADEGRPALEAALGIDRKAARRLRPLCHHLRFMQEIAAGTSLYMRGGVIAADAARLRIIQVLVNAENGAYCAIVMTDLAPIDGDAPWQVDGAAMAALIVDTPTAIFAQAIPDGVPQPRPDREMARQLMHQSGLGCFLPSEGAHGSDDLLPDGFIGRAIDSTRFLSRLFEQSARAHDPQKTRLGTAALECRLDYYGWAKVGDRFSIHSAFSEIGAKSSRRVVQWMFDEEDGRALASIHTLEINFDLDQRKARSCAPEVRESMAGYLAEALNPMGADMRGAGRRLP